jgi:hypothetical protein
MAMAFASPSSPSPLSATDPVPVPENPEQISTVNDGMSFEEAFNVARTEGGAGAYFQWHGNLFNTYYKEEFGMLSDEEKQQFYANCDKEHSINNPVSTAQSSEDKVYPAIVVHDNAPNATSVSDDMSFSDAFAQARAEVGPGGTFVYHDKVYNTYTKEETAAMSDEQKMAFSDSIQTHTEPVNDANVPSEEVDAVVVNTNHTKDQTEVQENTTTGVTIIEEGYQEAPDGSFIKYAVVEENGQVHIKIDSDNDGQYDAEIKENNDGTVVMQMENGETFNMSDMNSNTDSEIDTETDTETDTEIDTETDTETDMGMETGMETDSEIDSDMVTDIEPPIAFNSDDFDNNVDSTDWSS